MMRCSISDNEHEQLSDQIDARCIQLASQFKMTAISGASTSSDYTGINFGRSSNVYHRRQQCGAATQRTGIEVSKFDYFMVRTRSQMCWLNLPHSPILLPAVTAKQRVVIIPGDQPEEGIDGYGEKNSEKRKVLRPEWKTLRERSTGCRRSVQDGEEELGDNEGSNTDFCTYSKTKRTMQSSTE